MIGRRRNRGMSLGRVAKKAAVATVVNRVVSNAMDNRRGHNMNQRMNQGFGGQNMNQQPQQPAMNNICPSCHTGNPQHAKFCLNCGSGFSIEPQQTSQAVPSTNCPGCKANLTGVNGNFCPYCRSAIR